MSTSNVTYTFGLNNQSTRYRLFSCGLGMGLGGVVAVRFIAESAFGYAAVVELTSLLVIFATIVTMFVRTMASESSIRRTILTATPGSGPYPALLVFVRRDASRPLGPDTYRTLWTVLTPAGLRRSASLTVVPETWKPLFTKGSVHAVYLSSMSEEACILDPTVSPEWLSWARALPQWKGRLPSNDTVVGHYWIGAVLTLAAAGLSAAVVIFLAQFFS